MNVIVNFRVVIAISILIFNIVIIVTDLVILRKHLREQKSLNRVISFFLEDLKR